MPSTPAAESPSRERGSVTLEIAILAPVLMLMIFTIIQVSLWSYARSLALGAAQEGLAAARVDGATAQAGRVRALDFLARTAQDSLVGATVDVRSTSAEVQVEVSGHALSVLPGVPGLPVHQSASGPVERFTRP